MTENEEQMTSRDLKHKREAQEVYRGAPDFITCDLDFEDPEIPVLWKLIVVKLTRLLAVSNRLIIERGEGIPESHKVDDEEIDASAWQIYKQVEEIVKTQWNSTEVE